MALCNPRTNELKPGLDFWDASKTLSQLSATNYFAAEAAPENAPAAEKAAVNLGAWPATLHSLGENAAICGPVLSALGGCVSYLRQILLDK